MIQRYTGQLNDQETRLEKLRKEIEKITADQEAAEEKLNRMVRELTFDVKM